MKNEHPIIFMKIPLLFIAFFKNEQNAFKKNVDISLEICVKVKMYKKSMSISLQTYKKKGCPRIFEINIAGDVRTF